jgi:hypothetical protein
MKIHISYVAVGIVSMLLVSWCGTSSKVDKFIQQADTSTIVSQPVSSGIATSNTQSDDLLVNSSPSQDATDNKRWIYKDYTMELLSQAKSLWQKVVIVVYDVADDNCLKLDKAINSSLGRIPSDVMILKLEYKQARELYQVKEMNTVIYMAPTGKITNTSDGGIYTMDSLLYYL